MRITKIMGQLATRQTFNDSTDFLLGWLLLIIAMDNSEELGYYVLM